MEIESIINQLLNIFDVVYILTCNAATYFLLTLIESANGKKRLSMWMKRLISGGMALVLGVVFIFAFHHSFEAVIVGFFLQFLVYDYILKPILSKLLNKIGSSDDVDIDLNGKDD